MNMLMNSPRGTVRQWNPFGDMEMQFGKLLNELPNPRQGGNWLPAIDVEETADAYVLTADLPGMSKENIGISVKEDSITIRGERIREAKAEGDNYHRVERQVGTFERTFTVHEGFDGEKVDAQYENGVLRVTLPKREETKPREIDVKVK